MKLTTPLLPLGERLFLKPEGCNPTGSLRDRAVLPMIQAGMKPNTTLLLADWGPFALSAAWAAQYLGRKLELWLPVDAPECFVAQIQKYQCMTHYTRAPLPEIRSIVRELAGEYEESYQLLDPWTDPEHPMAYCESLAQELWEQTGGKLAAVVSGTDSCACFMGCATALKAKNPDVFCCAAPISQDFYGNCDPLGEQDPEFYVPQLCDLLSYCSLQDARKAQDWLFAKTGVACGVIGGAAVQAARELQKEIDGPIVVILPSRYDCF